MTQEVNSVNWTGNVDAAATSRERCRCIRIVRDLLDDDELVTTQSINYLLVLLVHRMADEDTKVNHEDR